MGVVNALDALCPPQVQCPTPLTLPDVTGSCKVGTGASLAGL